jgi:TonB family protein
MYVGALFRQGERQNLGSRVNHAMPPTVKDNDTLAAANNAARPAAASLPPAEAGIKQQPVALEVAVTVNGARALDGSDKREPFSESTKTVLVFGNGAVIRLSSAVAPGQLLFLTNEKTKKEVICQVVKSKNYRNVSGYVELEFTEPAVGFWGMRFPGDRVSAPPPAPAAPQPLPPKAEAPAAIVTPKISETKPAIPAAIKKDSGAKIPEPKLVAPPAPRIAPPAALAPARANPEVPVNVAPENSIEPSFPIVDPSRGADAKAFIISAQSETPPLLSTLDEANSPAASEMKPAAPAAVNAAQSPVSTDPETEALKQHTARLQEELSSLLFSGAAPTPSAKPVQHSQALPVAEKRTPAIPAAKVVEFTETPEPGPVWTKPAEHPKTAAPSQKSSLDDEELKIPAWLEPLARNAAVPASTEEPVEKEKPKRIAEQPRIEEIATEPLAAKPKEIVVELPAPSFGSELPLDRGDRSTGSVSRTSSNGLFVGAIAAVVLLLAGGGWWYMRQQSSEVQTNEALAAPAPAASVPATTLPSQPRGNAALPTNPSAPVNPSAQNNSPAQTNTVAQKNPIAKPAAIAPASLSTAPARNAQPTSNPANGGTAVASAVSSQPAPTPEPVKKATLGEVRLAAPKVTRHHTSQNAVEPDPGLTLDDGRPESDTETLNAGLSVDNKQPAAPAVALPVGGDVKQAKLISSIPPVYPALARNQHVSGDVRVDALIDANGRVTTMKVVSGPTLLHQAAMDALRQWKYQPASLDGKPVPMHLTVTIQFRFQ